MKKKILVLAFIALCLSMISYATVAYFTYEDTATNVITMGNIRIELQETAIPEGGGEPIPFKDAYDVLPGKEVSKIVQIKNVGAQQAWIRISVESSIALAEGVEGEGDPSLIGFDLNKECWIEQDGYYYYKEALKPGDTTVPLFTKVKFDPEMGNIYQNSKALIRINAQATQVIHNGDTVLEAVGWPKAE